MRKTSFAPAACCLVFLAIGCKPLLSRRDKETPLPSAESLSTNPAFEELSRFVAARADAVILEGDDGSRALLSPRLQGRLLTVKVGAVESTGFVNTRAIERGEADPQFNNFGGADRFWIYPEAGQFGLYFDPGAELDRKVWRVPPDLDRGGWTVASRDADRVVLRAYFSSPSVGPRPSERPRCKERGRRHIRRIRRVRATMQRGRAAGRSQEGLLK